MITPEISKAINGLKTNADKLNPKPSGAFLKVYKGDSESVLKAAKTFDRTLADADKGEHKEDYVDLKRTINRFFGELLKLAEKEPDLINVKLQKYVNAAEKDALKTADDEYKDFLKTEANQPDKPDPKLERAMLEALKQRAGAAERGQKAAKEYRAEAEKALATIKANHAKGGEEALAESQKLFFDLRISETAAGQDKDYVKGKKPLKQEHLALLKNARQNEATKLRLAGEQAAAVSERILDAGRDFRVAALKEIHAHQEAVEKANAAAAKDQKTQAAHLKKLQTEFSKISADAGSVIEQTKKEAWSVIEGLTEKNAAQPYKETVKETSDAYRELSVLNTKLLDLNKQVGVLRGMDDSEGIGEAAADLRNKIVALQIKFRTAHFAEPDFKKLFTKCNATWQERGKEARA